jgi:hypothetical protein
MLTGTMCSLGVGCSQGGTTPGIGADAFAEDCGLSVSLPTSRQDLVDALELAQIPTYLRRAPELGAATGDDVFPMQNPPSSREHDAAEAIIALCGSRQDGLVQRSVRYAFFVDAAGTTFHVEERSILTGP